MTTIADIIPRLSSSRSPAENTPLSPAAGALSPSPDDSSIIARIEREQTICRHCGGECKKTGSMRGVIPVATVVCGRVYETTRLCRYERARRAEAAGLRALSSANIPSAFQNMSFDSLRQTPGNTRALQILRAIATAAGSATTASGTTTASSTTAACGVGTLNGAYIWGAPGSGKTALAAVCAVEFVRRGGSALFITAAEFFADVRCAIATDGAQSAMRAAENIPLLVLDDVGAGRATSWTADTLMLLLSRRMRAGRATLFTSLFAPAKIGARLAPDSFAAARIAAAIKAMAQETEVR